MSRHTKGWPCRRFPDEPCRNEYCRPTAFEEFNRAFAALVDAVAEATRITKLVDWLGRKLAS